MSIVTKFAKGLYNYGIKPQAKGIATAAQATIAPVEATAEGLFGNRPGGFNGNFSQSWGQQYANSLDRSVMPNNPANPQTFPMSPNTTINGGIASRVPGSGPGGFIPPRTAPLPNQGGVAPIGAVGPLAPGETQAQGPVRPAPVAPVGGVNAGTPQSGPAMVNGMDFSHPWTQAPADTSALASAGIQLPFQNNGSASAAPTTVPINTSPTVQNDTNAMSGAPTTRQDVNGAINTNLNAQDGLLGQIQSYVNTLGQQVTGLAGETPEETSTRKQVTDLTNAYNQGQVDINNKPIAMDFITGQKAAMEQTQGVKIQALSNLLASETASRKTKLDAAKALYDTTNQTLQNTLAVYKATAPESLGVQVNQQTGDAYVITKNPITGQVNMTKAGNIGIAKAQANFGVIGKTYDANTGQYVEQYGFSDPISHTTYPVQGSTMPDGSTANGSTPYYNDPATGQPAAFTPSGTMRTDRNNNPIAASVAVNADGSPNLKDPTTANWLNTLSAAGIPYTVEQGANFGNRATIQFPTAQAGIAGAVELMKTNAFSWYKGHTGQAELANVPNAAAFAALPASQQEAIVKGIYSHEGGNGSLAQATLASAQSAPQQLNSQIQAALPSTLRPAFASTLSTGTPYLQQDKVPSALQTVANNYSSKLAALNGGQPLPILAKDEVSAVRNLDITKQNLAKLQSKVPDLLPKSVIDRLNPFGSNSITSAVLGKKLQTNPEISAFNNWRDTAINAIQGLAGGSGSGFRLNQAEIDTATSNLPTIYDTQDTANQKLQTLNSFIDTKMQSLLPNYTPATSQAMTQPDGTVWQQNGDGSYTRIK